MWQFFSAENIDYLVFVVISQLSCIILALLLIFNDFENFPFIGTVKNSWKKNRRFCKASKIKLATNWCNHWPQTDAKNNPVATNWRSDTVCKKKIYIKGRLNTDTSPQNFWTTFLDNDLTEKFTKSAVANAIAIPLPLCFSCFVPLRRFRENLIKPFYLYLSRTCDSPGVTPSVISLALNNERL